MGRTAGVRLTKDAAGAIASREAGYPEACRGRFFTPRRPMARVLLVLPGLNLQPAALDGLCLALAERGNLVYRGSLSGHGGPADRWPRDCRAAWRADTAIQVAACTALAHSLNLPFAMLGFSLGALCLADAALSGGLEVSGSLPPSAPLICLSPPFATRWSALPIRALSRIPGIVIPSLNTPELRVHRATAARAYRGVFALADNLWARLAELAPRRLLVACDPRDRLVAAARLARRLGRAPFPGDTFFPSESAGPDHHRCGIRSAHSAPAWQRLLTTLDGFLSG